MIVFWFVLVSAWILLFTVSGRLPYVRHWSNAIFPLASLVIINTYVAARGNFDVVDKSRYASEFESLSFSQFDEVFNTFIVDGREPAFLLFNWVIGQFTHEASIYFTVTAAVCSVMTVISLWLILCSGWQTTVVFFCTFCYGFFISYSSFLLRQGLSLSFLLLALALIFRRARMHWVVAVLVVGVLFHWSAAAAAILILVLRLFRLRAEILLGIWCLLSITYMTGVNELLAGPLGNAFSEVEAYSDPETVMEYTGGTNRLDFWILSVVPLIFGFVAVKRLRHIPGWYQGLLKAYLLLNSYYVLMGFLFFGDRLAAYSWSLSPLLIAVPFLNYEGRGQTIVRSSIVICFVLWGFYFETFDIFSS